MGILCCCCCDDDDKKDGYRRTCGICGGTGNLNIHFNRPLQTCHGCNGHGTVWKSNDDDCC